MRGVDVPQDVLDYQTGQHTGFKKYLKEKERPKLKFQRRALTAEELARRAEEDKRHIREQNRRAEAFKRARAEQSAYACEGKPLAGFLGFMAPCLLLAFINQIVLGDPGLTPFGRLVFLAVWVVGTWVGYLFFFDIIRGKRGAKWEEENPELAAVLKDHHAPIEDWMVGGRA